MTRIPRNWCAPAILVASLAMASCASVRPRIDFTPSFAATAEMARADELVRAGCYRCLTQALDIYERLSAGPAAIPVAPYRAVDTAILLAMRERELGLGSGRSQDHASALARELPAPADYSQYLSIIDTVGWKPAGVSAEQQDAILGVFKTLVANFAGWRVILQASAPRDLLSAYQLLSLDCLYSYRLTEAKQKSWPLPAGSPPLLRARTATCAGARANLLDDLLRDEPRVRELYLFQGERAYAQGTLRTAERHLVTALDELPSLMSARLYLGDVYLRMEDVESAFKAYHEVAAAVPGQRDAMIGEAKMLSYLDRSDEAITVLNEMVHLGTWYQGEAHYWLGWNRLHLNDIDRANDEVLAARKYLPMDPLVDKLSGRVAVARNEIERAEREFRAAMDHFAGRQTRDCDTNYLLASVLVLQRKWPEGGQRFGDVVPCFVEDEQGMRRKIEEINAADLPVERKARLVAAKQKGIAALQSQQARAAYNGAVAYANLGDKEKARPLAERAAQHPDMADLAQKLLARLEPGLER